jgi:uncharacterized DUF497 family protein
MLVGFEWDAAKAQSNIQKHGVSFDDACTVFDDPPHLTTGDPDHSGRESRFVTMGESLFGHLLIVCHCDAEDNIRIISARKANKHERHFYESLVRSQSS